ncbi:MAG: YkgJ family cysteine cluster protein [Kiritimatiellaeota bacterium]|nr:YkgJ family cysteine cluster protein [Kiritimatiellota bacterium]
MPDDIPFTCQRCGACCRVPGYVALAQGEAEAIAAFLGLDVYAFTERYTTLTFNRKDLSLSEQENGSCIFLQPDNTCRIQPVKPLQCQGFPRRWKTPRLRQTCPALT